MAHATGRDLFVQDTFVGADPNYRLPIRVINELAWHSLFARTMFITNSNETAPHKPEFTIINFPSFQADPQRDGTFANVHPDGLQPATRADRRHVVRRRNEEERVHDHELPAAATRSDEYALLRQRRR